MIEVMKDDSQYSAENCPFYIHNQEFRPSTSEITNLKDIVDVHVISR